MKQKIFLGILFLTIVLLGGCEKEKSTANNNNENKDDINQINIAENNEIPLSEVVSEISPTTVMDLFDGHSRIWYYIPAEEAKKGLAYDNRVKAVLVSENGQIISIYYNLKSIKCTLDEDDFEVLPNPFRDRFLLEEFDNMSDDEIINMAKESYANASQSYNLDINGVYSKYGYVKYDYNAISSFHAIDFPYTITYDGELDSTGNKYINETIYLFDDNKLITYFQFNGGADGEYLSKSFPIAGIIGPSVIKNKEYVGIEDEYGNILITENTYEIFDNIELDMPQ